MQSAAGFRQVGPVFRVRLSLGSVINLSVDARVGRKDSHRRRFSLIVWDGTFAATRRRAASGDLRKMDISRTPETPCGPIKGIKQVNGKGSREFRAKVFEGAEPLD
jgi:hypothetical protein